MSFPFEIPDVVDISRVDGSPQPRPIAPATDEDRRSVVERTGGKPTTEFHGTSNPYIDYESIDLLLSLQHPRSDGYHEMCFIIMGQVKELLFKGLYFELYNARLRIMADDLPSASLLLQRAKKLTRMIVETWEVLSTITTKGFSEFRDHLGEASGQQSFMYRHVEFILGNKSRTMCDVHANVPHVYPALKANLDAPSLYDEVIRLLERRGFDIATECLERDWSDTYITHRSVEKAWISVYSDATPQNDLYMLAETLVDLGDLLLQYRWRHFVSVERILGFKPGTGGSAGVGWLRSVLDHRFFPELWSIRDDI